MRMRLSAITIVVFLLLVGCNGKPASNNQPHTNWPTSKGNIARTNSVPEVNGPKGTKLVKLWSLENTNQIKSDIIISEGKVYFLSDSLVCLDTQNGKKLWEKNIEGLPTPDNSNSRSALCYDNGKLFATILNKLYCLDPSDGKELWNLQVPMIASSPLVLNNRVYITNSEYKMAPEDEVSQGRLFCFDVENGKKLWEHKLAYGSINDLIAGEGKIFVSFVSPYTGDPILTIVDALTGKELYYNRGVGFAFDQGLLFGSEFDLRAFDTKKMDDKWSLGSDILGENIPVQKAIGSNRLVIVTAPSQAKGNSVICINELDGKILWRIEAKIPYDGVTICGKKAYLTKNLLGKHAIIDILDMLSGEKIDSITLDDIDNYQIQAIADGKVFITSSNKITCLDAK